MRLAEWSGVRAMKPTTTTPSGERGCDEDGDGDGSGEAGAGVGVGEGGGRIRTRMEEGLESIRMGKWGFEGFVIGFGFGLPLGF